MRTVERLSMGWGGEPKPEHLKQFGKIGEKCGKIQHVKFKTRDAGQWYGKNTRSRDAF